MEKGDASSVSLLTAIDDIARAERRHPHRITVISTPLSVKVQDDIEQPDPLKSMGYIQTALASPDAGVTSKRPGSGGMGIFSSRQILSEHGGNLSYEIKGKRIVATATWTK